MKKVFIACAVALSSVALGAQQQNTTTKKAENPQSVIVSGCLVRGTSPSAAGTSSASTTPNSTAGTSGVSSSAFMLTKATDAQTGPAGTLSSNLPAQAASNTRTYRLDGHESELMSHVDHVVEIRGQVEEEAPARTTAPSASASKTGATTAASAEAHQTLRLKVDSVKELFSKCD